MTLAKRNQSAEATKKPWWESEEYLTRHRDGLYFHENIETFREQYGDCYVAIQNGEVVGFSTDPAELRERLEPSDLVLGPKAYIGYTVMVWDVKPSWVPD